MYRPFIILILVLLFTKFNLQAQVPQSKWWEKYTGIFFEYNGFNSSKGSITISSSEYEDKKTNTILNILYSDKNPDYQLIGVYLYKSGKRNYGFVNKLGEVIIPLEYDSARINYLPLDSKNGMIIVKKGSDWGVLNNEGKVILPFKYQTLVKTADLIIAKLNNKYGVFDLSCKEIIPFEYDAIKSVLGVSDYSTRIYKDKKIGMLDSKGKIIVPAEYLDVKDLGGGKIGGKKFAFYNGKSWGIINEEGKITTPFKYEEINDFVFDFAVFKRDGKYGYLNTFGAEFKYGYSRAYAFNKEKQVASIYKDIKDRGEVPFELSTNGNERELSYEELYGKAEINTPKKNSSTSNNTSVSNKSTTDTQVNSVSKTTTKTNEKEVYSGSVTIKNDTGEELHVWLGSGSGWMSNNATKVTRCEEGVKLYYSKTNKNADKKFITNITPEMCGKTLKLSEYK